MSKGMVRKILFYGPPGTGKSTLARQLARSICNGRTLRIDAKAFEMSGQHYISEFIKHLAPRVVLLDDMDRNPRIKYLHYMEDSKNGHIVIGTVNTITTLDPALLRPGRFDEVLLIKEPDREHLRKILEFYCEKESIEFEDRFLDIMKGFSTADVKEVLQCLSVVGLEHLDVEIDRVRRQRELYAGDKCDEYLAKKFNTKLTPYSENDEDEDECSVDCGE
jgi:transitional endoplasmic reticulum ATPase